MAERSSSLKPSAPRPKEDWSEKTATSWQEHTGFLERTNGKGFAAPLRLDQYAGVAGAHAAKGNGNAPKGGGSAGKVIALLLLTPALGAGVYFGAMGGDIAPVMALVGMAEPTPQVEAEAAPTVSKVAKNPNKGKAARDPAAAEGAAAVGAAVPAATAPGSQAPANAVAPTAPVTPAAAPVTPGAAQPGPASAAPASVPTVPTLPPSASSATLPTTLPAKQTAEAGPQRVETPEAKMKRFESRLHPLIKLSSQPNTPSQKPAASRDLALLALDHDEIRRLRETVGRDPSLNALVSSWRTQALQQKPNLSKAVATFRELPPTDLSYVEAKIELQKIRELTLATVMFGEPQLAKALKSKILAWTKTYKPLGDAKSDSEVEPVIEAFAFLQATLPMDERNVFDSWMLLMADRQVSELFEHPSNNDIYFAKHLKTMSVIGYATGNKNIQNYVLSNFASHVAASILQDGSTTTYQNTHSIVRHSEHLQNLLRVSVLLNRANESTADTLPTLGGSLARAIDFAYPFLLGKMEHIEFRGAKDSKEPETVLNPAQAMGLLDTAFYFRKSLGPEIASFNGQRGSNAWDPSSLYFGSMTRKTDNFESPLLNSPGLRKPTATEIKVGNKTRLSKTVRK